MVDRLPNIDYTSRDFNSIKESLLNYAAKEFPEWSPGSQGDFGVLMVEMFSYLGDVLSYYTDRVQTEAYLSTATQRASIISIAKLLGYTPGTGAPAYGTIDLVPDVNSVGVTVPAGTSFVTQFISELDGPVYFESTDAVVVPAYDVNNPDAYVTVGVVEGKTIYEDNNGNPKILGTSSGDPDQEFYLNDTGIYNTSVEVYVNGEKWTQVDSLLNASATDKKATVTVNYAGQSVITFGDGINGAVPPMGVEISTIYRVGVGNAGNVSEGAVTQFYNQILGAGIRMRTTDTSWSSAMIGGADPESVDDIRTAAPRVFKTHNRAVTLTDYETFALSVAGVAKAKAVSTTYSSVTVYIVAADGNPPNQTLIDRVTEVLVDKSLAGVLVTVSGPALPNVFPVGNTTDNDFISIQFGDTGTPIEVSVYPQVSNSTTKYAVEQALKSLLAVGSVDLGYRITLSSVYSAIMAVEGVRWVYIPAMFRTDAVHSGAQDIQLEPWEFPVIGDIYVTTSGGI